MDRVWVEQQAGERLGPVDRRPGFDQDQFAKLPAAICHEPATLSEGEVRPWREDGTCNESGEGTRSRPMELGE